MVTDHRWHENKSPCAIVWTVCRHSSAIQNSTTAKSGGGSFKEETFMGEVSCCDAWVTE